MNAELVQALIGAGELFHRRGWVPATAGNLSFRTDDVVAITRSGCHKGELTAADIVSVALDGHPLDPDHRCSAETLLHCQLYRRFRSIGAVMHTHSMPATVLSRRTDKVVFEGYEVLKALDGIDTHQTAIELPVFDNDQDLARLSRTVDAWIDANATVHGYLIRAHGLYAWGPTVTTARHRVEALEFLLECKLAESESR